MKSELNKYSSLIGMSYLHASKLLMRVFVVFLILTTLCACSNEMIIPPRTERESIYDILGKPTNSDSQLIAIWTERSGRVDSWREIIHLDPLITVFDAEGNSIIPVIHVSQSFGIEPTFSDLEICEVMLERFPRKEEN